MHVCRSRSTWSATPSTFGWNYTYSGAGGVDLYPLNNAALVQRLFDAGAVMIGKSNIPAFSNDNTRTLSSWDGATLNAVNVKLAPRRQQLRHCHRHCIRHGGAHRLLEHGVCAAAERSRVCAAVLSLMFMCMLPANRDFASNTSGKQGSAAPVQVWGVAEETGGSIQDPAAAQSLVGVKTTFGIVPTGGLAPLAGAPLQHG